MTEKDSLENLEKYPKGHDMLNMYGNTNRTDKDTKVPRAFQIIGNSYNYRPKEGAGIKESSTKRVLP
jgi:hypothetical protein